MKYIAILDTETTSLQPPPIGKTIEVAVMLFDVKRAQPVSSFSSLLKADSNEAAHINGIPPEMLSEAADPNEVWRAVKWLIAPAEAIVAHRAEFDQQFVPDFGKPFVCSKTDVQWVGDRRGDSLVQLALSMGLGVASAHRAMADVDTLSRILTRAAEMGMDLEVAMRRGMRPKVRAVAKVSYEQRDLARQAGFFWSQEKREWYRMMPQEDMAALPFRAVVST